MHAHPHSKRAGLGLDESLLMGGMGMGEAEEEELYH
jgi:hypothetical protein